MRFVSADLGELLYTQDLDFQEADRLLAPVVVDLYQQRGFEVRQDVASLLHADSDILDQIADLNHKESVVFPSALRYELGLSPTVPAELDAFFVRKSLMKLRLDLALLLHACSGELSGKTVLNLGCGSMEDDDDSTPGSALYHPWFSRFLAIAPLEVTSLGVDLRGDQEQEPFCLEKADLLSEEGFGKERDSQSVDVCFIRQIWDAPTFLAAFDQLIGAVRADRFAFMGETGRLVKEKLAWSYFQGAIAPHLHRLMKADGVIVVGKDVPELRKAFAEA